MLNAGHARPGFVRSRVRDIIHLLAGIRNESIIVRSNCAGYVAASPERVVKGPKRALKYPKGLRRERSIARRCLPPAPDDISLQTRELGLFYCLARR